MMGGCYRQQFLPQSVDALSRLTRLREMRRNSPFAIRNPNCAGYISRLWQHLKQLGMRIILPTYLVELGGVWGSARVALEATTTTHGTSDTVFDGTQCGLGGDTVVCTPPCVAEAAMGHWGSPHTHQGGHRAQLGSLNVPHTPHHGHHGHTLSTRCMRHTVSDVTKCDLGVTVW